MLQSIAEKRYHHPYIDGLRGIAILLVLTQHTYQALHLRIENAWTFPFIAGFLTTGGLGVPLFFLVSAFTLFGSSQKRWNSEATPVRNFYLRRFFRIFPLWGTAVLVYGLAQDRSLSELWVNFSMLFGFFRYQPGLEVVHVQWSLFVEEAFYLFLPLIFAFVRSGRHAFYLFLLTFFSGSLWHQYAGSWGVPTSNHFIEMFPLTHWYCFALGILLYFAYREETLRTKVLNNPKWGSALGIAAIVLYLQMCRQLFPFNTLAVLGIFVAAMHPLSWVGRWCRGRLLRTLGIACYSIYLTHPMLLQKLTPILASFLKSHQLTAIPFEMIFAAWFAAVTAFSLILAFFTFTLIEKPSVHLGKKFIGMLGRYPSYRKRVLRSTPTTIRTIPTKENSGTDSPNRNQPNAIA